MANLKISELTALSVADSADLLEIVDVSASQSKKITVANLLTGLVNTTFLTTALEDYASVSSVQAVAEDVSLLSDSLSGLTESVNTKIDKVPGNTGEIPVFDSVGNLVSSDVTIDDFSTEFASVNTQLSTKANLGTANTFTVGGQFIDGSTDVVQLRVDAHSTQTSSIIDVKASNGVTCFKVDNFGTTTIGSSAITLDSNGTITGISVAAGTEIYLRQDLDLIGMVSGTSIKWSNHASSYFTGSADTGISRLSAGAIKVTDGGSNLGSATALTLTSQRSAIGATGVDGLVLENTTAATLGSQLQNAPRIRLRGSAWKSNATAASHTSDWSILAVPNTGAAAITSELRFIHSNNGAASTTGMVVTAAGVVTATSLTLSGSATITGTVSANAFIGGSVAVTDVSADNTFTSLLEVGDGASIGTVLTAGSIETPDLSSSGDLTISGPGLLSLTGSSVIISFDQADESGSFTLQGLNGTMIGCSSDGIGFFGHTPVVQPAANPDTSGATLGQLETEVNQLKAALRSLGLIAT